MRAPFHPFGDIFDMIACIVIALITGYSYFIPPVDPVGIIGNYLGLVLCAVGYAITKWWTGAKLVPLEEIDLDTGVADYSHLKEQEEVAATGPWYKKVCKKAVAIFT